MFAKLNPGISYIQVGFGSCSPRSYSQGMNEVMAPLYYTLASCRDAVWREHAEADTFFLFSALMANFRDNFMQEMDDSHLGIGLLPLAEFSSFCFDYL